MIQARTIVVDRVVKSVNETMYKHWRAYMKERDAWFVALRAQLVPQKKPDCKIRISITARRPRILDYANYVAGTKPIPDCLIRLGYLHDDSPKWFHCDYFQQQAPKAFQGTTIHIYGSEATP